ncbi:hypothetical protein [Rhodocaloribacter sp.]
MKRFRINLTTGLLCLTATFIFGCDSVPDTIVSVETKESVQQTGLEAFFFGKRGSEKSRVTTMVDNYATTWDLTAADARGEHCVQREASLAGSSDAFPTASASGYVCKEERTVYLETINEAPDDCRSFSDAFVYEGENTGYLTFAGVWTSYCGEAVIASGTWDGVFDAPKAERPALRPDAVRPAMGRTALGLTR